MSFIFQKLGLPSVLRLQSICFIPSHRVVQYFQLGSEYISFPTNICVNLYKYIVLDWQKTPTITVQAVFVSVAWSPLLGHLRIFIQVMGQKGLIAPGLTWFPSQWKGPNNATHFILWSAYTGICKFWQSPWKECEKRSLLVVLCLPPPCLLFFFKKVLHKSKTVGKL